MRVAPFVGSFPQYRRALADHLVKTKLKHWEKSLREVGTGRGGGYIWGRLSS